MIAPMKIVVLYVTVDTDHDGCFGLRKPLADLISCKHRIRDNLKTDILTRCSKLADFPTGRSEAFLFRRVLHRTERRLMIEFGSCRRTS